MASEHATLQTGSQKAENIKTGIEVLVIVLALITCVLRFYARRITGVGIGYDDWFILAAVVSTLATAVLLLAGTSINHNGAWVADNTNPDYVYTHADILYLKLSFISSIFYFTIASSTKLGILLMYNRLFSVDRSFRLRLYIISFLVTVFWISTTVARFTNCVPLEYNWINNLDNPRYCFNYNIFWMASGVCEVLLDVLILALPIQIVLRLQMLARNKAKILLIFMFGGFTVITGIIRVILGYVPGSRVPSHSRTEVWTTVHAGMAIICACLPVLRPILTRMAQTKSKLVAKIFGPSSPSNILPISSKRHSRFRWSAERVKRAHNRDNSESALLEKSLTSTIQSDINETKDDVMVSTSSTTYTILPTIPSLTLPSFISQYDATTYDSTATIQHPSPSSLTTPPPDSKKSALVTPPVLESTLLPQSVPPPTKSSTISRTATYRAFPSISRSQYSRLPTPQSQAISDRKPPKPADDDEQVIQLDDLPPLMRLTLNLSLDDISTALDDIPYWDV